MVKFVIRVLLVLIVFVFGNCLFVFFDLIVVFWVGFFCVGVIVGFVFIFVLILIIFGIVFWIIFVEWRWCWLFLLILKICFNRLFCFCMMICCFLISILVFLCFWWLKVIFFFWIFNLGVFCWLEVSWLVGFGRFVFCGVGLVGMRLVFIFMILGFVFFKIFVVWSVWLFWLFILIKWWICFLIFVWISWRWLIVRFGLGCFWCLKVIFVFLIFNFGVFIIKFLIFLVGFLFEIIFFIGLVGCGFLVDL